jgi:hypothetical protein
MFPVTSTGRIIAGAIMHFILAFVVVLISVIGNALMASLFGSSDENAEPETLYLDAPDVPGAPIVDTLERLVALESTKALSNEEFERATIVALWPS